MLINNNMNEFNLYNKINDVEKLKSNSMKKPASEMKMNENK
ncbi:hypothetical protein [Clostridium sp.]|jgi:hypothetical protein|nr:hypothetical protein [Clostridium sp.]MDF2505045.1 hypothetical protein [Clostridium sp.]